MAETTSKIQSSFRVAGYSIAAASVILVLGLYYLGEFREFSKYLFVVIGAAAAAASLAYKSTH